MYTADGWPIAAKISYGPYTEDGQLAAEAPASVWREQLAQVAELGYRYIDPMDDWVPDSATSATSASLSSRRSWMTSTCVSSPSPSDATR